MIKWYNKLETGSMTQEEVTNVIRGVTADKIQKNLYFIMLPQNPANLYDIIKHVYLLQDYYKNRELSVIGIAKSKSEAIQIAGSLVAGCIENMGKTRLSFDPEDFSEEPVIL